MKISEMLKRAEKLQREVKALRKSVDALDVSRQRLVKSTRELENKLKVLREKK